MSADLRKYVRVYYDDLAHEFPEVYADDALLAAWLRLLVIAERMWPAHPEIPRSVRPRPLARLVDAQLVTLLPAHCYSIRGLHAERTRRQATARNAAAVRWHGEGNAPAAAGGHAAAMPRQAKNQTNIPPNPPRGGGRRANGTNPRSVAAREREDERRRAHANRLESTQRRLSDFRPA